MFAVIKKKHLIALVAILCLVVISSVLFGTMTVSAQKKLLPIYCTDDEMKVAISFDAAWGSDKTRRIVDILNDYGVNATFFLTGFWIDANLDALEYIHEHGIEIGNHSENHYNMSGLSKDAQEREIESVNEKIKAVTGFQPQLFRAPFGDYNNSLLTELDKKGMYCIQWDVDSLDWKGLTATELKERVLPNVKGGSIVLFHNNSDHIVEALPDIIEGILSKGLKLVSVGELIYKDNYTIDNTGKQQRI